MPSTKTSASVQARTGSRPKRVSSRRESGFTLIEILAAFVIFALVFATTLQILSGSLRNTQRSAEYSQAALWAQSVIDALGLEPPIEEGSYSDTFDDDYRWEMEIRPYEVDPIVSGSNAVELIDASEVPVDLYHIELVVYWGEGDRERRAVFRTLRSVVPEV